MEDLCRYCQHFYVDDEDKCRCGYDKPHECDEPCYIDDLEECCGEFQPTKRAVKMVETASYVLFLILKKVRGES